MLCHTVYDVVTHSPVVQSALVTACGPQNRSFNLAAFCIFSISLQAVVKLPFADVKRLAITAQQPDANEQELQPADEVCICKPCVNH